MDKNEVDSNPTPRSPSPIQRQELPNNARIKEYYVVPQIVKRSEKKNYYQCDVCLKQFPLLRYFRKHLTIFEEQTLINKCQEHYNKISSNKDYFPACKISCTEATGGQTNEEEQNAPKEVNDSEDEIIIINGITLSTSSRPDHAATVELKLDNDKEKQIIENLNPEKQVLPISLEEAEDIIQNPVEIILQSPTTAQPASSAECQECHLACASFEEICNHYSIQHNLPAVVLTRLDNQELNRIRKNYERIVEAKNRIFDLKNHKELSERKNPKRRTSFNQIRKNQARILTRSKIWENQARILTRSKIWENQARILTRSKIRKNQARILTRSKIRKNQAQILTRSKIRKNQARILTRSKIWENQARILTRSKIWENQARILTRSKIRKNQARIPTRSKIRQIWRNGERIVTRSNNNNNFGFESQKELSTVHKLKPNKKAIDQLNPFECNICQKTYSTKPHLKRHKLAVHEGFRYKCDRCQKEFSQSQDLRAHVLNIHDKIHYQCDQCPLKYALRANLKNHKLRIHDGVRFKCDICFKDLCSSNYLARHKVNAHGVIPHGFCNHELNQIRRNHEGVVTRSRSNINKLSFGLKSRKQLSIGHILKWNKSAFSQQTQFECNICEKTYSSNPHLKRHKIAVHEGFRYKCGACQKEFSQSQDLRCHVLNVHDKIRYKCDECPFQFTLKSSLKNHKLRIHDGVRFKCNKCFKDYCSKGYLRQHKVTVHGVIPQRK